MSYMDLKSKIIILVLHTLRCAALIQVPVPPKPHGRPGKAWMLSSKSYGRGCQVLFGCC